LSVVLFYPLSAGIEFGDCFAALLKHSAGRGTADHFLGTLLEGEFGQLPPVDFD
jgi:hypothetical protein